MPGMDNPRGRWAALKIEPASDAPYSRSFLVRTGLTKKSAGGRAKKSRQFYLIAIFSKLRNHADYSYNHENGPVEVLSALEQKPAQHAAHYS